MAGAGKIAVFFIRNIFQSSLTAGARQSNLPQNGKIMLLRISLIVAILAGLVAGGFTYVNITDKIPMLTKQRDDENTAKKQAQQELATTKTTLKKTQSELASTQQELANTKTARDKAQALADQQKTRGDELADKLNKSNQERDNAVNSLAAYTGTGKTPEQVLALDKSLRDARTEIDVVNGEKAVLLNKVTRLNSELDRIRGVDTVVRLPSNLSGKILVVNPRWDFVVMDVGEDQGVLPGGEILVSRDGKLVAKVVVRTVEKDRSIANLVPGWKLGDMIEGDQISPAHPAT